MPVYNEVGYYGYIFFATGPMAKVEWAELLVSEAHSFLMTLPTWSSKAFAFMFNIM